MCSRRRENGRSARDKTENKPRQLVVSIARGVIHQYIEGYLQDPAFEGHWRAGLSTADELVMTHWYYKDKDGLLFFWGCRLEGSPLHTPLSSNGNLTGAPQEHLGDCSCRSCSPIPLPSLSTLLAFHVERCVSVLSYL